LRGWLSIKWDTSKTKKYEYKKNITLTAKGGILGKNQQPVERKKEGDTFKIAPRITAGKVHSRKKGTSLT